MTERSDIDLLDMKRRLTERRMELLRLAGSTRDAVQPVALDQTSVGRLSRMDAMQVQAMALETERRRGIELTRIDAALQRIADDEFGYCRQCGEDIPAKRLEADPTTTVCVACARKRDD